MTDEERLEKLEKELAHANRHARWLLAGVTMAIVVALSSIIVVVVLNGKVSGPNRTLAPLAPGVVDEIRAHKFVLVDQNGETRAFLEMGQYGPLSAFYDSQGRGRVLLAMDEGGPRFVLSDEQERVRAQLYVDKNGPSITVLCGVNGWSGNRVLQQGQRPTNRASHG